VWQNEYQIDETGSLDTAADEVEWYQENLNFLLMMMAGSTQVCRKKTNWNMNSHWNKVNAKSMSLSGYILSARHKSKFYKLSNRDIPFITAPRIILINSKLFTCYAKHKNYRGDTRT
jgi:hypothetical protein